jgi:flagellar hook-length control protein FliK
MTMQTTTLPFQVAGANATGRAATPDRLADAARDNGAFSATLNREMAARQPAQQPPQPAAQQAKPAQQGSKPHADKPATREPVRENGTRAQIRPPVHEGEAKTAQAAAAESTEESSEAAQAAAAEAAQAAAAEAAAAATAPVTDMLAFMASLTKPASAAASTVSTDAAAAGAAASDDAASGELQLTALESALDNMKALSTAVTDDTVADASGKGLALATGMAPAPTELRTTPAADAALPRGDQDAVQFQAQLRETLRQAAPAVDEAPAPVAALQAQAAKLDAVGNPAAVPGDRIAARVGTQAWDNQVSQRIVYMVGKEQAATLTLNPPDLGPVQIVLNVTNDQATVTFSSNQLEVRQALENAMPRLREMMSESGIALGNATVDAGVPNGRGQQDSERRAQAGQGGTGGVNGDGQDVATPALNEVAPRTRTVAIGDRGMVDLFA